MENVSISVDSPETLVWFDKEIVDAALEAGQKLRDDIAAWLAANPKPNAEETDQPANYLAFNLLRVLYAFDQFVLKQLSEQDAEEVRQREPRCEIVAVGQNELTILTLIQRRFLRIVKPLSARELVRWVVRLLSGINVLIASSPDALEYKVLDLHGFSES